MVLATGNDNLTEPLKMESVIIGIVTLLAYVLLGYVAPIFGESFAGFGADLPMLTTFVLDSAFFDPSLALLGILPGILVFGGYRSRIINADTLHRWNMVNLFCCAFVVITTMTGLYLPIFQLGTVE